MSYQDDPALLPRLLGPTILGLGAATPLTLALCGKSTLPILIGVQMITVYITDVLVTHCGSWRMIRTYYDKASDGSPNNFPGFVLWILLVVFAVVFAFIAGLMAHEYDGSVSFVGTLNATATVIVAHLILVGTLYHLGAHNEFQKVVRIKVGQKNRERRLLREQTKEAAKEKAAEQEQKRSEQQQDKARKQARAAVETFYNHHPLLHDELPSSLFNIMLNAQIPDSIVDTTAIWSMSEQFLKQLTAMNSAIEERQEKVERERRQIDKEIAEQQATIQSLRQRQIDVPNADFLASEIASQEQEIEQLRQQRKLLDG